MAEPQTSVNRESFVSTRTFVRCATTKIAELSEQMESHGDMSSSLEIEERPKALPFRWHLGSATYRNPVPGDVVTMNGERRSYRVFVGDVRLSRWRA